VRQLLRGSLACTCLISTVSYAHSFGTSYVLPVPFWMYVYGCAATLVVTFALLGFLASTPTPTRVLTHEPGAGQFICSLGRSGLWLLRTGAIACFGLTIAAGLIGTADPAHNLGMTLFWALFLLGFAYLSLLVGDLYALISPWKLAVDGLEHMGFDLSTRRLRFPQRLGYWPAFLFYVALIWMELFAAPRPFCLSVALLIYSAITFVGVALFGKATWFCKAELFSVLFRLIGKLAPIKYMRAQTSGHVQVQLRPPFVGALNDRPAHISVVLFVLFMLSSTTYDSIHDTALFVGLFWANLLQLLQPIWGPDLGKAQTVLMGWYLIYRQVGLLVLPFLYLGLYLLMLLWAKALTRTTVPLRTLSLSFSYSLLPIALAYNFTHYFTFLVVQCHNLPQLISDPFGFGWELFGIQPTPGPPTLPMGVVWHTQVAVLLVGHIVSIYLAHATATRTFFTPRPVILSQIPLLSLMVIYTIVGLWTLSLPLGAE
jgi:hypothetical protein